ncbi:MAG: FHA domain-containing protein [Muribaculaceae bacterium]|nr:FHA domain-containing protein [Muribaculaceae bacterium]
MEIIIGRKGNQKTPITDPTVSREHCKVFVNPDGTFTIENLSQLGTKVDGREIIRATARLNSRLQLGQSFSATLLELIGDPSASSRNAVINNDNPTHSQVKTVNSQDSTQEKTKAYNISHLRKVWEDYNRTNVEMAEKQRKINLSRTGLGIFTMCAMPTIFFFGPVGYALTAIGVLGNIFSFVGMRNAETAMERQRRQDAFDDAWICPNPNCGHSLMAKNYKMLLRNFQSCPYCKCKYIEK